MGSENLFHTRKARELERRKATKTPSEVIRIICEGKKTEVHYFNDFIRAFRIHGVEVLHKHSSPISIVNYAIELAKNNPQIDRIYCVCDRDEHATFNQAIDKINSYNNKRKKKNPEIIAITSTPSFEIWYKLHYGFDAKPYTRTGNKSPADNLAIDLGQHVPNYNKESLFDLLNDKTDQAIINAQRLKKENQKTKNFNPETDVHILVCYLKLLITEKNK